MKRLLGAALLTGLTVVSAQADNKWQGDMFVTANSGAPCAGQRGTDIGDFYRAVYRQGGLPQNGANDMLAIFGSRSALHIFPTSPTSGHLNGTTLAHNRYIFGSAGFSQFLNRATTATVSPDPATTSTPTVTITLGVTDMFTAAGCNVTLTGTLSKRP